MSGDFHLAAPDAERRLAGLLRQSLRERGLVVAEHEEKADLVVLPTLGRVSQIASSDWSASGGSRERAGGSLNASRLRRDLSVPGAAQPQQQVGLLLTAVHARDYRQAHNRSLRPVWRIYVSRTVDSVSWDSAVVPLVRAASSSAAPLAAPRGPAR